MAFQNPSPGEIKALLQRVKTIAVVGLSPDPDRPSYSVAMYLQGCGYRIVPVRPGGGEILGEKVYARLSDIPFAVDIVDHFRRSSEVGAHIDEAIELRVPAVWMQEGIVDEAAAARAREAGLMVVMDRCMLKEHRKSGLSSNPPGI
ncbi:MAG: CoA-binding protein [Deltaproteobacteria bacterium 13_1_20CM_2_69_21]|nr:MAG: CoA-binding protein [Deltaproteobacteria bacterium 13_1_40CM_68_24]OLC77153.1 MAG: CoA-binding protein [Deltaproteobacteria bacterium 13_1_40CM_4_68_19]OLD08523.1 MAG: CoA-binding protein [Deltaproteobacteria bacterium 13_1_40CM_3_69_14]OLD46928.1 MAG: CoA-binding protein [Chloroflexi bacterium 13_1_40CM_2_68_14]OLE64057.1 MAG: CoA-binding protein [Deltaproteobacteria bacterium 13_1_20CM_2_69_21]TMA87019.1 MAG: CoA-binding protein [Deltaproteobacteria bacterium]